MKPKPKRGRPALAAGDRMQRVLVTLDRPAIDSARRIGSGNVSAGIRKALSPRERIARPGEVEADLLRARAARDRANGKP